MPKRRVREGICKLTHQNGRFVDSHILPKALTRADGLETGLQQLGQGRRQRRWSSWYDNALVTEEGEKVLADYDNWAISFLRKHKLVWSGWGPMQTLDGVAMQPDMPRGLRKLQFDDSEELNRLRLFLLSILWRSAATAMPEFSEIDISQNELEVLREMVLDGRPQPFEFYPITLTQISTLGERHNHAPIASVKQIPALNGSQAWDEPIFRFFIDGLIVHFSRLPAEDNAVRDLGPLRVGNCSSLIVATIPYEASAQYENLEITKLEAQLGRPLCEIGYGPFDPRRRLFD